MYITPQLILSLLVSLSVYGARNIFAHITKSYINRAGFKVYPKIYSQAAVKVDFVALSRHTAGAAVGGREGGRRHVLGLVV